MQADPTMTTTDCFSSTSTTVEKWRQVASGWYNFDIADFLGPLYATIEASNSLVDLFVMCETTNLAKQFSTRFTTWSGILDLCSTVGVSFLKDYVVTSSGSGTPSELYLAGEEFFTSPSCTITSRALGKMLHHAVFFEIADTNYEELLLTNITA